MSPKQYHLQSLKPTQKPRAVTRHYLELGSDGLAALKFLKSLDPKLTQSLIIEKALAYLATAAWNSLQEEQARQDPVPRRATA